MVQTVILTGIDVELDRERLVVKVARYEPECILLPSKPGKALKLIKL